MELLLNVDCELIIAAENPIYNFQTTQFHKVRHERIKHKDNIHVRGDVHTNIGRSLFTYAAGLTSQACPGLLKADPIHYQHQDYADDNCKNDRHANDAVLEGAAQFTWLIFWRLRYAACHIWQ
jgi:hypothetical protein